MFLLGVMRSCESATNHAVLAPTIHSCACNAPSRLFLRATGPRRIIDGARHAAPLSSSFCQKSWRGQSCVAVAMSGQAGGETGETAPDGAASGQPRVLGLGSAGVDLIAVVDRCMNFLLPFL